MQKKEIMKYKVLLSLFIIPVTLTAKSMNPSTNHASVNSHNYKLEARVTKQNQERETVFLKGKPMHTFGLMPQVGVEAPNFTGTDKDLKEISLQSFKGKKIVLNIFPSLDTPTCAASVRHFNEIASRKAQTVVLCISMDLPFAQRRFCTTEGLDNVIPLSVFRSENFRKNYPIQIADGPMKELCARAVIVIDEQGKILHTELVKEISEEPNYEAALRALE